MDNVRLTNDHSPNDSVELYKLYWREGEIVGLLVARDGVPYLGAQSVNVVDGGRGRLTRTATITTYSTPATPPEEWEGLWALTEEEVADFLR